MTFLGIDLYIVYVFMRSILICMLCMFVCMCICICMCICTYVYVCAEAIYIDPKHLFLISFDVA